MPEEDVVVTLTVTAQKNGKTETKKIKVNVVPSKKDPFTVAYKSYEGKYGLQTTILCLFFLKNFLKLLIILVFTNFL